MSRLPTLALSVVVALSLPSCVIHLGSWDGESQVSIFGQSVEERNGELYLDDVHLAHERWETVTVTPALADRLELGVGTGDIEVTGAAGSDAVLEVLVHSSVVGGGRVTLDDNRLMALTDGEDKAFINAIRGSVPAAHPLRASSGTGQVSVTGLEADLQADSGTGDVIVRDVQATTVRLESGTGEVRVEGGRVESFEAEVGTDDVILVDLHADRVEIDSGTGDVSVSSCELGELFIDAGTGDITLRGSRVTVRAEVGTGTGDLDIHGGEYARLSTDMGTGDISLVDAPMIDGQQR